MFNERKNVSEKGLELLTKIEKNGIAIECPHCGNKSFRLLGGFLDLDGKVHTERRKDLIEIGIVMCNECLCFNIQRKLS